MALSFSATFIFLFFFLLLRFGSLGRGGSGFLGGSRGGGAGSLGGEGSEGLGVFQELFDFAGALEGVIGGDGDGDEVAEGVGEVVGDSRQRGDAGPQAESSQLLNASQKLGQYRVVRDVENAGEIHEPVFVDLSRDQPVRERLNVQLLKQCRLGRPDLVPLFHQLHVADDFDLPLVDLRGDVQGLLNEVWPGSSPVGPAGRITSMGEIDPARATAGTLMLSTSLRMAPKSWFVNRNPTFPFT